MSFEPRFSDCSLSSLDRKLMYRSGYTGLSELDNLGVQPQETNPNSELYVNIIINFIMNIESESP